MAGCGVPVRRDWGLKCPECHGTLSSNTQPRLWPSSPLLYITGPADRSQMGPHVPACLALVPPGIKAGFSQSILISRWSVLLHVSRQQGRRRSQGSVSSGGRAQRSKALKYCSTDIVPAIKLNGLSAYSAVSICMQVWRYVVGFHSVIWVLIDWYFHYGCRVAWRLLICLGVLQVYGDCSRARRKAE